MQDKYNYFREKILLYLPWRNERLDVEIENCYEKYLNNIAIIKKKESKYTAVEDCILDKAVSDAQIYYE